MSSKLIVTLEYWGVVTVAPKSELAELWPQYKVGKRTSTSQPMDESEVDAWIAAQVSDPQLVIKKTLWRANV